jgi:hypothetical protein
MLYEYYMQWYQQASWKNPELMPSFSLSVNRLLQVVLGHFIVRNTRYASKSNAIFYESKCVCNWKLSTGEYIRAEFLAIELVSHLMDQELFRDARVHFVALSK